MKKIKSLLFIILSLIFINLSLPAINATSSTPAQQIQQQSNAFNSTAGFGAGDLSTIISLIIRAVLSFLALIFVILIIMSGFKWMTAAGNETQVKSAQDTLKMAIIGLIIVLAAYSITYFIFNRLPFDMAAPSTGTSSG